MSYETKIASFESVCRVSSCAFGVLRKAGKIHELGV
jgi:hypothetical protein